MPLATSTILYSTDDYKRFFQYHTYKGADYTEQVSYPSVVVLDTNKGQTVVFEETVLPLKDFYSDRLKDPKHSTAREMAWAVLMEDSEAAACALADFLQERNG